MADDPRVHNLDAEEVARGLAEGKLLLVDVREPSETEVERYPQAFYLPMSEFDPAAIPDPQGRRVVFACRSGNRSVTASLMAQAAGLPYDAHLAGGIKAWKALGLPTEPVAVETPPHPHSRQHNVASTPVSRPPRCGLGRRAGLRTRREGAGRQRL